MGAAYGQAAGANAGAQGQQNAAMGYLANAAAGRGPSAAGAQLQAGTDQAMQNNMAMAASARGQAGLANAQKNALTTNASMGQSAANQAAQLRAQEMQSAQSQYSNAANQMQNQYAQQQQGYAGGMQQAAGGINQFNEQQAGLQGQQNALNQQGALAYQQLGFNAQAEQLQAMESNQQAANSLNQSNAKNMSSGMGGILGAVGGAAFLSDKRSKTNIKDAGDEIDDALSKMGAHAYEYKYDPGTRHIGTMAQELSKSDAGSRMVRETPKGLMIDIPEAQSFSLGALSRVNTRLNELEDSLNKNSGTRVGESRLKEPRGGESAWTLREEPDFLLARNDRTGQMQKVGMQPLTPEEEKQTQNPHGAGPISTHGDFDIGSMLGGIMGGGSSSGSGGSSGPAPVANPNQAISPQMMGYAAPAYAQQSPQASGGDMTMGQSIANGYNWASKLNAAAGAGWSGGI